MLEEVGCDVSITHNDLVIDSINFIFGSTELDEKALLTFANLKKVRYIVYDTEIVTSNTINNRKNFPFGVYVNFLKNSMMVISGIQNNINFYKTQNIRAKLFCLNYTQNLSEIVLKQDRDIDVFFFGLLTDYRIKLLSELKSRGHSVVVHGYDAPPYFVRNSIISRSKIVACLNQNASYDHINGVRVLYLAANGCCAVAERPPAPHPFAELMVTSENANSFADLCSEIITNHAYADIGDRLKEAAKSQADPVKTVELLEFICDSR